MLLVPSNSMLMLIYLSVFLTARVKYILSSSRLLDGVSYVRMSSNTLGVTISGRDIICKELVEYVRRP